MGTQRQRPAGSPGAALGTAGDRGVTVACPGVSPVPAPVNHRAPDVKAGGRGRKPPPQREECGGRGEPPKLARPPRSAPGTPKLGWDTPNWERTPQTGKGAPKLGRDPPNWERTHTKLGEELPKLGKDPLNWEMTLPNWERIPQTGQGPPKLGDAPRIPHPGLPLPVTGGGGRGL